ncbi:Hypothetical protein, putative [Bodo saltans]|uniref:Thioredoxin-like fold domain-containing protein n=1 Tax=Bodo saltans TaxID=75058 RepID=A0A0S4J7N8_BODSA|nr:Hypothetical protein, putative [Bodo saltans]|eukprot:CUG86504.1 Hypothetical protein, putative [Bodo saltans]
MRLSARLLRMSPKAGGGWSNPTMQKPNHHAESLIKQNFGVEDLSLVNREKMTVQTLAKMTLIAAFRPQDADAKVHGGDGATHRNHLKGELKRMDKRIQPFAHDDLCGNTLKTINELDAPNGAKVTTAFLEGKVVGLLFFSESVRSKAFMQHLDVFHKFHTPDFVVICVSMATREHMQVTKRHGFFHVTHANGATWVTRDAGVQYRPLTPLPRLIVVNGTTGHVITRSGLTAVMANPTTCFAEWAHGRDGCDFKDYYKAWFL